MQLDTASHNSSARRRRCRGARSPSLTQSQTSSRASPLLATKSSTRFDRFDFSAHHRISRLSCFFCQVFSPYTCTFWKAISGPLPIFYASDSRALLELTKVYLSLYPPRCCHRRHSDVGSSDSVSKSILLRLSWADTAVSTFDRLYNSNTRKLPYPLPAGTSPVSCWIHTCHCHRCHRSSRVFGFHRAHPQWMSRYLLGMARRC